MTPLPFGSRLRKAVAALTVLVLVATASVVLPAPALAQGPTATIGSYTIPDVDGTVSTSLTVDTAGADVQAVGVTVGYDAALVQVDNCTSAEELFACNTDEAGVITIESVNPAGWGQAFTLATIDFTGLGTEATAPLTVTVDEAYDSDLAAVTFEGVDGSITVSSRAPAATLATDCADGDGQLTFSLDNPMDDPVAFVMQLDGVEVDAATLDPGTADSRIVGGAADGARMVSVLADGVVILESMESFTCDPEIDPTVTCGDAEATITVKVTNYTDGFATYRVTIGSNTDQRSISSGLSTEVSGTTNVDGPVSLVAQRNGEEIYNDTVTVDCGFVAVEPTPTPVPPTPTPTPVPPTPTPVPDNGGGPGENQGVVEVGSSTTCLAENGRVDTNIVNTGDAAAVYRIEFQGLSARQTTVAAGDWWRMPITGRADGDYSLVVKRDGVVVSDTTITVACDTEPPSIVTPEVQVVNACRAGNGYILFQFANNTDASKSYIIEFEGVQNRSTSAAAYGGTVRAVTGRPDGEYNVKIRNGVVPLTNLTVTVNC